MQKKIKLALSLDRAIATADEGVNFTPTNGVPYQEVALIPSFNAHLNIDNADYRAYGILQILLKYPNGVGLGAILDRTDLLVSHYPVGKEFKYQDVKVRIIQSPKVLNLGVMGDRVVWAISVNYHAFKM